jgi:nucleoid-associated protein YgaU
MGKFEKLVVLTVLFAAAVVLAISLSRGGDEVEASDPLSQAQALLERGDAASLPAGKAAISPSGYAVEPAPTLLLHAGTEVAPVAPTASGPSGLFPAATSPSSPAFPPVTALELAQPSPALSLERASDPTQPILRDVTGLRPSFLDEYKKYTVVEGDTWAGLAQRFFQDGRYTRNLHLANEDLSELTPGKEILVPVFDLVAVDAGLRAGRASEAPLQPGALGEGAPLARSAASTPPVGNAAGKSAKPLEYEVRAGDTLSDISLAVFGTATRWKEILEANKDLLQKPESLQVGMKLKIPEGGKLPAAAKPEAKPKTAQGTEKPASSKDATSKKRKVL